MRDNLKIFFKVIGILLLAIFQIVGMPCLAINGLWPNLILILAVILIVFNKTQDGFLVASLGGLILDLAGYWFFGFNLITIFAATLLVRLLVTKFLNEPNEMVAVGIIAIMVMAADVSTALISHQQSLIFIGVNIIYSAAMAIIIYQLIKSLSAHRPALRIN